MIPMELPVKGFFNHIGHLTTTYPGWLDVLSEYIPSGRSSEAPRQQFQAVKAYAYAPLIQT
jgi:hypothetical protein